MYNYDTNGKKKKNNKIIIVVQGCSRTTNARDSDRKRHSYHIFIICVVLYTPFAYVTTNQIKRIPLHIIPL